MNWGLCSGVPLVIGCPLLSGKQKNGEISVTDKTQLRVFFLRLKGPHPLVLDANLGPRISMPFSHKGQGQTNKKIPVVPYKNVWSASLIDYK